MTAILQVRGLNKAYGGVQAVKDVSFAVNHGELRALIGPNGAGKTTCFNLLNGQLSPDSGEVVYRDRAITGLPPRRIWRLGIGRTFQIAAPFASMTVLENVQMALISHHGRSRRLWSHARNLYHAEAMALLQRLDLEEAARQTCGTLAYGDIKRLELAVALAHGPDLLLMDEPTAGMAPEERAQLMDQVKNLVEQHGMSVLFTEHDMSVVFRYAHRVLVLDQGAVLADGTVGEVRRNSEVQRIYLGDLGDETGGQEVKGE
ncbi:ABC transporter ATP-binding protein [Fodinicurvata halophila]|uniref:ABC transporter ATP-binding protein n=1 Tax=Fodinicurvata halophila TaxID=1419723 RepID=A0ABV8UJP5_9PROT